MGTGGQIEGVGKDGAFDYLPPPPRPRDSTSLARNLNATAFGSLLDAAEAAAAIPGPFDRTVSTFWDFTRGMHDVEKEQFALHLDENGQKVLTIFARRSAAK